MDLPSAGLTSRTDEGVQTRLAARWWAFVEAERTMLPLWLPVAFAAGIAAWFGLPWADQRLALAVGLAGIGLSALVGGWRPLAAAALLALAGMAAAEWRSARVAHPVLAARSFAALTGEVTAVEPRVARGEARLFVAPDPASRLPPLVRLTLRGPLPPGLAPGARVSLRSMLSPPTGPAVPGGYDFARVAWFQGVGATGLVMGRVTILRPAPPPSGLAATLVAARAGLTAHISAAVPGPPGAIAAAFVTGDQGGVPLDVAQAMRDAGLAHLLSISGLHIAVVVGGTIFLVRRTLGLFPWLVLRWPVKTIAVAVAALVGILYTLLAGAEVPTVRTILATLIVLFGMVMGREAFSLRLLAAAAFLILAVRPEALLGASFQLSFAAVIAIVALYESRLGRWLTTPSEDERLPRRGLRLGLSLLVSGLVAELALSSIGLFHFNRTGLYGVFANLAAIPWTSLVIMPLLMLALLATMLGAGALVWPLVGWATGWLIALAEWTAALPGSVVRLPAMPPLAFLLIITGGLWLTLWRSRVRWWGLAPVAVGAGLALLAPVPDVLVSSDGRQVALRLDDGRLAFLRPRASDFLRDMWGDAVAGEGDLSAAELPGGGCSADACVAQLARGGRTWRLLMTRSRDYIDRADFEPACARADIVVSDRRLPGWCSPRWLKLDRPALAQSGAVTIALAEGRVKAANMRAGDHPWHAMTAPQDSR